MTVSLHNVLGFLESFPMEIIIYYLDNYISGHRLPNVLTNEHYIQSDYNYKGHIVILLTACCVQDPDA